MIGRTEFLRQREVPDHKKANMLDLSPVLKDVGAALGSDAPRICKMNRNDGLDEHPLDDKIIQASTAAIRYGKPVQPLRYKVKNTARNIGTKLSGEIALHHGNHGLPDGTVDITCEGSAGQSFAAFVCGGVKLTLIGEANDYVGKGLCGGEIILRTSPKLRPEYKTWENSILGNTVMYGATSGRLYAAGRGGERFCVRNSGATAVVEGVGDHGCEYMTGGVVVVLGSFGRNFGAYLLDETNAFESLHNAEMIKGEKVTDPEDINQLKKHIFDHLERTDSPRSKMILENWATYEPLFVKVTSKAQPVDLPPEEDPMPTTGPLVPLTKA
jgi:glutamate synthase domain-containing protein 3